MSLMSTPRTWMKRLTPAQRQEVLAYRRSVLRLPLNTPRQDHPYPEFFTTGVYMIWHHFTMAEEEYLNASFPDFEFYVRKARAGKWLTRFLEAFLARFPDPKGTSVANSLERRKSIPKIFINALSAFWSTEEGRPQMKDGRMDVMTVRLDILHEYVDDFEFFFPLKQGGLAKDAVHCPAEGNGNAVPKSMKDTVPAGVV
ncbi:hypothetical protein BDZ89DRAFT_1129853 [Hymenopellis radicata]|nr:hypothetical protein BDZ89DRAFT_1129853 [Hymenopellis radicata]